MDIDALVTRADGGRTDSFEWGEIRWLDGDVITAGEGLTAGRVTFDPGAGNATHRHPNCEEFLYLVSGALAHSVGDEATELSHGDLLHIPRGEPHDARNLSADETAVALVAYDTDDRAVEFVDEA
ncbi:MAG: cupin domain-containing protein [Halobacteriaceae archaeon]